jgi:hypothetical protein
MSGHAVEHAVCADVLVDFRPMDAVAIANQFPLLALGRRCFRESPRPCERNADHSSIDEIGRNGLVGDVHVIDSRFNADYSAHIHYGYSQGFADLPSPSVPLQLLRIGHSTFDVRNRDVLRGRIVWANPPPAVVPEWFPHDVFLSAKLESNVHVWRADPPPPTTKVGDPVNSSEQGGEAPPKKLGVDFEREEYSRVVLDRIGAHRL